MGLISCCTEVIKEQMTFVSCMSLCLSVSLCFSLCIFLSLSLSLSLSLCLSLSSVYYTNLTLPKNREVYLAVVAV